MKRQNKSIAPDREGRSRCRRPGALLLGLAALVAVSLLTAPTSVYGQDSPPERGRRGARSSEDRGRFRGRDREERRRERDERENAAKEKEAKITAPSDGSLSFGKPKASAQTRGFGGSSAGASSTTSASARDRDYARGLLTKYDGDGDRVLSENEWRQISGDPEKADANGDKRITFDELVARVSQRRREKAVVTAAGAAKDLRSYRLAEPQEKLPEGLPSWFTQRDRNGDGQVAMHEWSRSWNRSTVRDFTSKDANGDGLITPSEAADSGR